MTTFTNAPLRVGQDRCCSRYLNGAMDEVRVWNVLRTQEEIRENMHLTLKGNETGLVAYYQFNNDDPAGTAGGVKDASGNSNDGTTVNVPINNYIASEVAVAGGTSDRITITSAGAVNLPNTDVSINFGALNPDGEIVVSRLETEKPHGWSSLTGDVDDEYFVIRNFGNNTTFDALNDITFNRMSYVSPADVGVTQAASPLQLYKRDDNAYGATWGSSLGGADNATAGTNGSIGFDANNNLTSFSQIVIVNTGNNSNLPVELLAFEATRTTPDEVVLDWSTVTETNNKGFYIERMLDHETTFQTIGFVQGNGTSTEQHHYQYTDANSFSKTSYYRLKQVDFDGSMNYSPIKAVNGMENIDNQSIAIYPNPVEEHLNIRFQDTPAKNVHIQLMSINGQVIQQINTSIAQHSTYTMDNLQQLEAGVYILSIRLDDGQFLQKKLIKL